VIIRSTTKAGRVVLNATAEDLKPASVEIVSRAVSVAQGLSLELPGAGLASNLVRGPTPETPSFTVSRRNVPIAHAIAGANQDRRRRALMTMKPPIGPATAGISNGWIKYDFCAAGQG